MRLWRSQIDMQGFCCKGSTRSCGCLQREAARALADDKRIHNLSRTQLYNLFGSVLRRCYKPTAVSYQYYGGRGIGVCDEWRFNRKAFLDWSFANGHQPGLQLDRIDNEKGYSPDNCRWVTRTQNANNKTNNRRIEFRGGNLIVAEWSRRVGINRSSLIERIENGWTIEEALTTPRLRRQQAA